MFRRLLPAVFIGVSTAVAVAESPGIPTVESARTVVVLGDSLSAGFGVDPAESWPSVLQEWTGRLHPGWKVVNAGVSGDTSAGGLRRLDWLLRKPIGVLVLELGGNDGLRGLPIESTRSNLVQIIDRTRSRWPAARIVVAGMRMPENFGKEFTRRFESLFREVAKDRDTALVPFLLEGVGGDPSLNLPDQIHPNPEGHRRVATNVWNVVAPILRELQAPTPLPESKPGLPNPKDSP